MVIRLCSKTHHTSWNRANIGSESLIFLYDLERICWGGSYLDTPGLISSLRSTNIAPKSPEIESMDSVGTPKYQVFRPTPSELRDRPRSILSFFWPKKMTSRGGNGRVGFLDTRSLRWGEQKKLQKLWYGLPPSSVNIFTSVEVSEVLLLLKLRRKIRKIDFGVSGYRISAGQGCWLRFLITKFLREVRKSSSGETQNRIRHFSPQLHYSTFLIKWEFAKMGIWAVFDLQLFRDKMGIRKNGDAFPENRQIWSK